MEMNKIFAAVLVAAIVASLSGFVADKLVHAEPLKENAVKIEGVADASAGAGAVKEAAAEPILAMIATADVTKGQTLSKACAACHSFTSGGANGVGPNLYGIVGRAVGAHAGYTYSDDMKAKGGNWGYAELNKFLWKPKSEVAGTKMTFMGIKKPEDRAAVIAWLRTLADTPAALPTDAEITAEAPKPAEEAAPAEAPADATAPAATTEEPKTEGAETPKEEKEDVKH